MVVNQQKINNKATLVMKAKIGEISELSDLLNVKSRVNANLLNLFSVFKLGVILSRLSIRKEKGVALADLILALCLFRINGESIYSVYQKRFYDLLDTGKNCYYRLMNHSNIDWRGLHLNMVKRFLRVIIDQKAEETNIPSCYIIDDTTLSKKGVHMERISRVYDHVSGGFVLGYKLLLLAFFDGRSTLPCDFSLHREKGKSGKFGLRDKDRKKQFRKQRKDGDAGKTRLKEADMTKMDCAIEMIRRAWKNNIRASYALMDSWFTCEKMIREIQKIGKGNLHFIGLAKMATTKYKVAGKKYHPRELISLFERKARTCRKYKSRYIAINAYLGEQPVRIFLIRYGHNDDWNILLSSDQKIKFVDALELYQIRWNIEVLNKECKGYLSLGGYQGRDFDGQIADCTLCFLTYIALALSKRFSDYETIGGVFAEERERLLALTLWRRILDIILRLLETVALCLGLSVEYMITNLLENTEAMEELKVMLDALGEHRKNKGKQIA